MDRVWQVALYCEGMLDKYLNWELTGTQIHKYAACKYRQCKDLAKLSLAIASPYKHSDKYVQHLFVVLNSQLVDTFPLLFVGIWLLITNTDKNTSPCQIEASDNFVFGPFVIKSINGRHLDDSVVPEKNPYFFFLLL